MQNWGCYADPQPLHVQVNSFDQSAKTSWWFIFLSNFFLFPPLHTLFHFFSFIFCFLKWGNRSHLSHSSLCFSKRKQKKDFILSFSLTSDSRFFLTFCWKHLLSFLHFFLSWNETCIPLVFLFCFYIFICWLFSLSFCLSCCFPFFFTSTNFSLTPIKIFFLFSCNSYLF